MRIYVVRPGDSVYSIARSFGVTPESILESNKLQNNQLVIGQTVVVPSTEISYRVRPGDTLWSISRKFRVSPESIQKLNNLQNPSQVYPGLILRIPENAKNYGTIEVNAFIQPSTKEKEDAVLSESLPYLTYITPFSHHVTETAGLTPLDDENIINQAKKAGVNPMLSVTNITGTTGSNFNSELISNILNSETLENTLINNILSLIRSKGYYGVIVDFERIPPKDRENYNNFLRKLTERLHPDYKVATALAPKTYDIKEGSWHGAHDYKAHGEIVDFVIIMTYEWGWSGGPPLAVAPIDQVEKVIRYAVSVIPPSKIMMGIPLYGYDWTLPYIPKGEFAETIGNDEAIERARKYGARIKYDIKSQSPYYNYVDAEGRQHVVWFEDARSVEEKYKLVFRYKLKGVSYWVLARSFTQNFKVLDNMFMIKKYNE
ncbi:glycoside hydrolase family 18 protein [Clostridium felsineum]|uniref:glycoside hydrolase family 18 protein n=1 Tax=Clostridium felsineum TaxID=36839 RepID=UPI00214D5718|nr:glycoside hydrolase family 18 protein [Clostridium felsineum]MCR3760864.1 glycoside hydrolase family 18 protein [Clostridium felsineum]